MRHICACAILISLLSFPLRAGDSVLSPPPVALKMYGLFERLRERGAMSFQLSEWEINEYLKYSLRANPRPGLESVHVKIFPLNYVSTFTVVDFDAVERWRPGTVPVLLKPVLHGKKSIWVDYRFQAQSAKATFSVEKAYFGAIRLPALLVEKVIQIVAARQPERYDTSKPVPIPFGLQQVWTQAKVVYGRK